jgi:hypothetical protein
MTRRAARPIRRSRDINADGWRGVVTGVRVFGLILVVATAGTIGWLVTDDTFAVGPANAGNWELTGLRYTDSTVAINAVALSNISNNNVFLLRTTDIRRRLLALPSVADADVRVVLPNRLIVAVTDRTAVLRLRQYPANYLIDGDGLVLDVIASETPQVLRLPLIEDRRVELGIPLEVGKAIDPTEATAMLQIGALTPSLVGSSAPQLTFSVDDADGFVVSAGPDGWRAVFGFYTPTLRPPSEIAQQVQCLRSLLATGESVIDTIYLAPQDDRCGTYLPRPS